MVTLPETGGHHGTLVGTTATDVDVTGFLHGQTIEVFVINLSTSSGPIYARGDGTVAVGAEDGTKIIEPGGYVAVDVSQQPNGAGILSIVGEDGFQFSVERA